MHARRPPVVTSSSRRGIATEPDHNVFPLSEVSLVLSATAAAATFTAVLVARCVERTVAGGTKTSWSTTAVPVT